MLITFTDRPSDSPVIERVWRSHSERAGTFVSLATCQWGMVVSRVAGRTTMTVRGPESRATAADCPADGEWVGVQFRLGTFMPLWPAGRLRDRRDATLPGAATSFWLDGSAWEYPSFENAETFVQRLVHRGVIVADPHAQEALRDPAPRPSQRTDQRRILRATGLTRGAIRQIGRARRAVDLLRRGLPIAAVAADAGYYDQAHLTRSLTRFAGQTPAQIARGEAQLSLLYNTDDD